ncbi:MAG: tRNA glutamyl-Q(34) synthetase GluQRS [Gallionella sp.]|jgi:glutamyl-Q tRNA(Asp) synthetase
MQRSDYRGRFAPSPTGPLHFGSLIAALGSYLDAKHNNGRWLVRMEDLDTSRCVPGAADDILRTLAAFGLHSDEAIIYQSQRTTAYRTAFEQLRSACHLYPCTCTRREIADSALRRGDELIYPGNCRAGLPPSSEARSWRVRVNQAHINFADILQGSLSQNLASEAGDFVVKRADGLFAYQLAVVIDDAAQGITHVVRGADLLTSTPRQIYLQRLLRLPTPAYLHLPVAVNAQGEKLSKQTQAQAIGCSDAASTLFDALRFLHQQPPGELRYGSVEQLLSWAVVHWRAEALLLRRHTPDNEQIHINNQIVINRAGSTEQN